MCSRCTSLALVNTWMRPFSAGAIASAARSMSARWVRASAAITGPRTCLAISLTHSKSPCEVIGKPASMMSTFRRARAWAMSSFCWVLSATPGLCSPSRSVVSKNLM